MNDEHFQSLLARVLDDELTPAQSDELIAWLRQNPPARVELAKHLVLWDIFSQQTRAERSAKAFAEACRTRIAAETDRQEFVRETEQRLRRTVEERELSLKKPSWQFGEWLARFLPSPRWVVATAMALLAIFVLPGFLRIQGVPELASVAGNGRIEILRGQQAVAAKAGLRLQANDVIRTLDATNTVITYGREETRIELKPNTEIKLLPWERGKRLELREGKLDATVARQRWFRPMLVTTPQAEARVLGTEFTLTVTTNATRLDVSEGKVKLTRTTDHAAVKVPAGHYAIASDHAALAALPKTGFISREWWSGVSWENLSDWMDDPRFPNHPDGRDQFNRFEMELVTTNRFGMRLLGYVHPPVTGDYEFWQAGQVDAQLFLSPNEQASGKIQIVITGGTTRMDPREWDALRPPRNGATRRSGSIHLEAGKRYYIEAIVSVPNGDGHLSVAWKRPGAERELLDGRFLSPAEKKK